MKKLWILFLGLILLSGCTMGAGEESSAAAPTVPPSSAAGWGIADFDALSDNPQMASSLEADSSMEPQEIPVWNGKPPQLSAPVSAGKCCPAAPRLGGRKGIFRHFRGRRYPAVRHRACGGLALVQRPRRRRDLDLLRSGGISPTSFPAPRRRSSTAKAASASRGSRRNTGCPPAGSRMSWG